jgi:SAM-dependent methyltransferase
VHTSDLTGLAMWQDWQRIVEQALPSYARSPIYVNQDVTLEEMERIVAALPRVYDVSGMVRDVAHGARVFETSRGAMTRQWVDGNIEINFLVRALPSLRDMHVLDIGAGYGRLAVMLAPLVESYTCVDPVPVSTMVSREYTRQYAPAVTILDLEEFCAATVHPTIAINIHSWNECSYQQIANWLEALATLSVRYLFTVTHEPDRDIYLTWDGRQNFKTLLTERYTVIAEECLGFRGCPHVLWERR